MCLKCLLCLQIEIGITRHVSNQSPQSSPAYSQNQSANRLLLAPYVGGADNAPVMRAAWAQHHESLPGLIQGVDIIVPALALQTKKTFDPSDVSADYVKDLARVTGSVNDNGYRGFAEGELLLLSANGEIESEDSFPITFRFQASENVENLTVGGIEGIDKKGHEYLWVQWIDTEDDTAKELAKKASAVYIEEVYPKTDFGDLNLE